MEKIMKEELGNKLNSKIYKTKFQTHFIKDGIYYSFINPELKGLTVKITKELVKERLEVFNEQYYPVVLEVGPNTWVPKETMQYFENFGKDYITKLAIIINSQSTKILANLYLKFFKPTIPTELFVEEPTAISWIKNKDSRDL